MLYIVSLEELPDTLKCGVIIPVFKGSGSFQAATEE